MNSVSLLFKGHSRKNKLDVVRSKCGLCTEEQVSSNRAVQAVLHLQFLSVSLVAREDRKASGL